MKLNNLTKEELQTMGYDEIAYMILDESGKKMKLKDLFQKVCKALDYNEDEFADHITDFFELLSTNKTFIMLENGFWDLQTKHKSEITIEEAEEDSIEVDEEEIEVEEEHEETEEDIFYEGEETDDVEDDDLADLVVMDEDEEAGL